MWEGIEMKKEKREVIRYALSMDGKGLIAFLEDKSFYPIHNKELSKLEKWILKLLSK